MLHVCTTLGPNAWSFYSWLPEALLGPCATRGLVHDVLPQGGLSMMSRGPIPKCPVTGGLLTPYVCPAFNSRPLLGLQCAGNQSDSAHKPGQLAGREELAGALSPFVQ